MSEQKLDIAYFIAFCVEQYKHNKNISGKEAMDIFSSYSVDSYLSECYEVLHTQGPQWIMNDIDEYITLKQKEISR